MPLPNCEYRWNILGVLTAAIILEGTFYLLKHFWEKQNKTTRTKNRVLFFPDSKPACKAYYTQRHGCTNTMCRYSHSDTSFGALMKMIYSARSSMDLCIFCFTSPEMSEALVDLHSHGVVVRVIADVGQLESEGSKIGSLRAKGIQVRQNHGSSFLMHHKFVLIDGRYLVTGSFNWTRQAVTGNNENVLITSDSYMVNAFKDEFKKLWDYFHPSNYVTQISDF